MQMCVGTIKPFPPLHCRGQVTLVAAGFFGGHFVSIVHCNVQLTAEKNLHKSVVEAIKQQHVTPGRLI